MPSATKYAMAASRSSTTMLTWCISVIVTVVLLLRRAAVVATGAPGTERATHSRHPVGPRSAGGREDLVLDDRLAGERVLVVVAGVRGQHDDEVQGLDDGDQIGRAHG